MIRSAIRLAACVVLGACAPALADIQVQSYRHVISADADPAVPALLDRTSDPHGVGIYLVFVPEGRIGSNYWEAMERAGAKVDYFLQTNGYIVRMTPAAKTAVSKLSFVRGIRAYKPAYKLHAGLYTSVVDGTPRREAKVIVCPLDVADRDEVVRLLNRMGSGEVAGTSAPSPEMVLAPMTNAQVVALAKTELVYHMEEWFPATVDNNFAAQHAGVRSGPPGTATPATNDLLPGVTGDGVVVCLNDTGCDTGVVSSLHQDLQPGTGAWTSSGAKVLGGTGGWADTTSSSCHGTHVSGSVLGTGAVSLSTTGFRYKGEAYNAKLWVIPFGTQTWGTAATTAASNGAHLMTCSYSSPACDYNYGANANSVDTYINNNRTFLITKSAGNTGCAFCGSCGGCPSPGRIGNPATAKNLCAVGCSENKTGCSCTPCSDQDIASFTSVGPTADGRWKPDVIAPGDPVTSIRCAALGGGYQSLSGTSMSTPHVAGLAALLRHYYQTQASPQVTPSASLLKATLCNGATLLTGNGGAYNNNHMGFGRPNLQQSLFPVAPKIWDYRNESQVPALSTSGTTTWTQTFTVTDITIPVKVTLAWTDPPAPSGTGSGVAYINNLNLTVTSPSSTVYMGNGWSGSGVTPPDTRNNIEQVRLAVGTVVTGTYTITVTAANGPSAQNFSIVWSFGAIPQSYTPTLSPTATETWNPSFSPSLTPTPSPTTTTTNTRSATRTATYSSTRTNSGTHTISLTPSNTNTATATPTNTATVTPTVTETATPSGPVVVYPNPFVPGSGLVGGLAIFANVPENTTIRLYTVSGQLVRTLVVETGSSSTFWEGANDWGAAVAPGLYYWVVERPDGADLQKGKLIVGSP